MKCLWFRKQVEATREDADRDGVTVPTTLEEYCVKTVLRPIEDPIDSLDLDDCYDDDYVDDDSGITFALCTDVNMKVFESLLSIW